jgi:hypothetical protein
MMKTMVWERGYIFDNFNLIQFSQYLIHAHFCLGLEKSLLFLKGEGEEGETWRI